MYGVITRHVGLQKRIRKDEIMNCLPILLYTIKNYSIPDLLRKQKLRYKVPNEVDGNDSAKKPRESGKHAKKLLETRKNAKKRGEIRNQRLDNPIELFDLADEALAKYGGKMRCGFLIASELIERPLKNKVRVQLRTDDADVFKDRLAHADRPTVGEVSASATELSAHNKDKWTMDMLVEAFNHAAGSALCLNPVTGAQWNTRIKVACKNAQSILDKDC